MFLILIMLLYYKYIFMLQCKFIIKLMFFLNQVF